MIPEIGNIFLIISFVLAVSIFCLASYSYYLNKEILNLSNLVYFKFVSILMSFIALEISFLSDDFSVLYVALTPQASWRLITTVPSGAWSAFYCVKFQTKQ